MTYLPPIQFLVSVIETEVMLGDGGKEMRWQVNRHMGTSAAAQDIPPRVFGGSAMPS